MTATVNQRRTEPHGSENRRGGPTEARTGTLALARLALRRDRVKLPAWLAGLGLYVLYVSTALPAIAETEEELATLTPLLQQPVGRLFTGPAYGMDDPNFERFFGSGYLLYLFILAALMSILLITRHTRAEEESGRAELVRASVVGRQAHLTAALIVAVLTNLAVAVVVTSLSLAAGYGVTGSLLVGSGTALVGIAFAGITAVTVQLSEHGRSASGMAGAVLGVAFLLRALGDMAAVGGSPLSWASPLGWASQTGPYVLDRWWPLLLLVALTVVTAVSAFLLQNRRDLDAGLLATRHGPPRARPALGTPNGLAVRLQRGAVLGWGTAIVLLGTIDGAFTQVMIEAGEDMPDAFQQVIGAEALRDGYLALLVTMNTLIAAAYIVFAVQGLRSEETYGRAEAVLATPTSRTVWAGSHLLVIAGASVVIMLVAGLGTGLGAAVVTGDWSLLGAIVAAHMNVVPALLVVLALCTFFFGWSPSLTAPAGWALVGLMGVVGLFADLLDLPEWVRYLSPIEHPAQLPAEDFTATPLLWLTGVALLGVGVGLVGLGRRQIYVR